MSIKENFCGLTPALTLGLAFAILLDTATQLLWKFAIASLPENVSLGAALIAVFHQSRFFIIIALFLLQLVNWLKVLKQVDLSYAQPITSLSYLTVAGVSWWFFNESIGPIKSLGILCILAGVWLTSQGAHNTQAAAKRSL